MACTNGISARLSWVLAAEVATASGRPAASVSTCSLAPDLPRSTGFGPISSPTSGSNAAQLSSPPRETGSNTATAVMAVPVRGPGSGGCPEFRGTSVAARCASGCDDLFILHGGCDGSGDFGVECGAQ